MNGKGDDGDPHEKHVVEDSLEDIEFSQLDLLGVDLVEYLHENEGLEDVSEMESLLGGCALLLVPRVERIGIILRFGPLDNFVELWLFEVLGSSQMANEWQLVLKFPLLNVVVIFRKLLEVFAVEGEVSALIKYSCEVNWDSFGISGFLSLITNMIPSFEFFIINVVGLCVPWVVFIIDFH